MNTNMAKTQNMTETFKEIKGKIYPKLSYFLCLILTYFLTNDLLLRPLKAKYLYIFGLAHFFLPRSVHLPINRCYDSIIPFSF